MPGAKITDKQGRREEHWNAQEHTDRADIVRALDAIVEQTKSAADGQKVQEDRRSTREKVGIVVAALVLGSAVAQWFIFRQQLQIGNAAAVSLTSVALENFGGKNSDGDPYWLFIPHIENSGNTPTQKLAIKSGNELTNAPTDEDAWDHVWKGKNLRFQYTSIGPHVTIPGFSIQTNAWFLNQMVAGKASLYLVGEATYNDIFGWSHITQFCIQAIVPIRDYTDTTIRAVFISTTQCPAHNCIDDECKAADKR